MLELQLDKTGLENTLKLWLPSHEKAVVLSVQRGIKRTLPTLQKVSWRLLSKRMRLPRMKQKELIRRINPQFNWNVNKISGAVVYKSSATSLISYVRGPKKPRSQKGKRVKSRTGIKYEIKPGVIRKGGSMFIAKGNNNNMHVFRRMSIAKTSRATGKPTAKQIRKMSGPNPAIAIRHSSIARTIAKAGAGKLQAEYNKSLLGLLQKMRDGK